MGSASGLLVTLLVLGLALQTSATGFGILDSLMGFKTNLLSSLGDTMTAGTEQISDLASQAIQAKTGLLQQKMGLLMMPMNVKMNLLSGIGGKSEAETRTEFETLNVDVSVPDDFVNVGVDVKRRNRFDGDELKRSDKNGFEDRKPMSNKRKSFPELQRGDPRFTDELTLGKKMKMTKIKKGNTGKRKGMKKSAGVKKTQNGRNDAVESSMLMGKLSKSKLKSKPDSRPRGTQAILGRKLLETVSI